MCTKKTTRSGNNGFWILFAFLMFRSFGAANASGTKDDMARYYHYTNLAELAIVEGNAEQSAIFYDSAFIAKTLPFAVDLYNAIHVNLQTRNKDRALQLCFKLSSLGVGAGFFSKSTFSALKNEQQWGQLLSKAAAAKEKFQSNNKALLKHINALVSLDQQVARKRNKEQFDNPGINTWAGKVSDSIAADLLQIFRKKGYLSEFKIGVHLYDDTTLAAFPAFDIIIAHNVMRLNPNAASNEHMFDEVLRKANAQGNIKSDQIAQQLDGADRNMPEGFFGRKVYSVVNCILYRRKMEPPTLESINNNRKAIFLMSLSDYERKLLYKLSHPDSMFMLYAGVDFLSFSNKDIADRYTHLSDPICSNIPDCTTE